MEGTLHLVNEVCYIVEGNPGLYLTEVAGRNSESLPLGRIALARQPATQRFIHDLSERAPGAARFGPELGRNIIIES